MPHNIGQMFYYGERPWHQLGAELVQPATISEALDHGGLDWEVALIPMKTAEHPSCPITSRVAVVRTDRGPGHPGRVIGVVHPGFRPLQNWEGFLMFDSLLGRGQRVYHTGGYLGGGEVVWLLARLPKFIQVRGEDVLESYLLFTNSHDGSVAIDIRLTTVRVVCQNTLSLALRSPKKKQIFRRAHRGSYDLVQTEASGFFKFALDSSKEAQELFTRLASKTCSDAEFQAFLTKLLREPVKPVTAATHAAVKKGYETRLETIRHMRSQILQVHRQGIPDRRIPPAKYNWWEALNSVTAWVDHVQQTESDRYAHNLLGAGDRLKSAALELVIAQSSV